MYDQVKFTFRTHWLRLQVSSDIVRQVDGDVLPFDHPEYHRLRIPFLLLNFFPVTSGLLVCRGTVNKAEWITAVLTKEPFGVVDLAALGHDLVLAMLVRLRIEDQGSLVGKRILLKGFRVVGKNREGSVQSCVDPSDGPATQPGVVDGAPVNEMVSGRVGRLKDLGERLRDAKLTCIEERSVRTDAGN
jgi:hypothetical protein